MPMRWTDEKESLLWKTIFNTHAFHIDLDAVSKAWPEEEKPTPKALKEHLSKWRKAGETKVTFGMSAKKGAAGDGGSGSAPVTPRKRGPNKKTLAAAATPKGTATPKNTPTSKATPKWEGKIAVRTREDEQDQEEEEAVGQEFDQQMLDDELDQKEVKIKTELEDFDNKAEAYLAGVGVDEDYDEDEDVDGNMDVDSPVKKKKIKVEKVEDGDVFC
ncbi:hypothetical protein BJY04DRAFT_212666 [Aspergillus karnatakaensis]|uniref:uncharacterized protein n=1 Tax=Aspergillus karnatakaensis TaxID=1810916 RepID=UPI003CCE0F04